MIGLTSIYYLEVNLICIVILLLFRHQLKHQAQQVSMSNTLFHLLIWANIVFCIVDTITGVNLGKLYPGARIISEVSNMIYFEALTVIAYVWMLYVFSNLKIIPGLNKKLLYGLTVPFVIFTLIALSNPITHILFVIDENNIYIRSSGVFLHWIITWSYLAISTIVTARTIIHEKNRVKRQDMTPLLYFAVAPTVSCLIQMCCYGITSAQAGITISLAMIFLTVQSSQVLTDSLTGLNNRRGFDNYLENYVEHNPYKPLGLIMIDLNNFKRINDELGHLIGDCALQDAADALKQACKEPPNRMFLGRYGGDEFILAGTYGEQEELYHLKHKIHKEFEKKNETGLNPYVLAASIGIACGKCANVEDVRRLLREADVAMYEDKKHCKSSSIDVIVKK